MLIKIVNILLVIRGFMKFDNILKEMFSRVIFQLYKEYDHICYQYKLKLKKPMIIIEDLSATWGTWNSQNKIITLSSKLISDYSWDIVLNILKHEMAHQIVSEIFLVNENHGIYFLKACDLIALPKEYRKSTLNMEDKISHWKNSNFEVEDQNILRKVEKLLSLAQSANENESLLAMEKVQEIYSKYNIKRIQDNINSEYCTLIINFKKKVVPSTYIYISSLIQSHYFVNVIYSDLYDPLSDESHKIIEIIGTKQNVLMAEFVFYFLKERINSLWENYQKINSVPNRYKLSYQKGILDGFQNKLNKIQSDKVKNLNSNEMSKNKIMLILQNEDLKLNSFTKNLFPKLTKKGATSNKVYTSYFDEGKNEGKKIILNKPMNESTNKNNLLK